MTGPADTARTAALERFAAILRRARMIAPFGLLDGQDRRGLLRRAAALGIPARQAAEMIADATRRPRHPVTRGIE